MYVAIGSGQVRSRHDTHSTHSKPAQQRKDKMDSRTGQAKGVVPVRVRDEELGDARGADLRPLDLHLCVDLLIGLIMSCLGLVWCKGCCCVLICIGGSMYIYSYKHMFPPSQHRPTHLRAFPAVEHPGGPRVPQRDARDRAVGASEGWCLCMRGCSWVRVYLHYAYNYPYIHIYPQRKPHRETEGTQEAVPRKQSSRSQPVELPSRE